MKKYLLNYRAERLRQSYWNCSDEILLIHMLPYKFRRLNKRLIRWVLNKGNQIDYAKAMPIFSIYSKVCSRSKCLNFFFWGGGLSSDRNWFYFSCKVSSLFLIVVNNNLFSLNFSKKVIVQFHRLNYTWPKIKNPWRVDWGAWWFFVFILFSKLVGKTFFFVTIRKSFFWNFKEHRGRRWRIVKSNALMKNDNTNEKN